MRIPVIRGIIDRRILVNYRVDPDVLRRILPPPFRPQLVGSAGVAGICLIRLKQIRPRILPGRFGITSENAAHRIAVEWDGPDGQPARGVYIRRRDTSSWLNALAGGRLFPGEHQHAHFRVDEHDDAFRVAVDSDDQRTHVLVAGRIAAGLPPRSMFGSLAAASEFFHQGSLGYSVTANPGRFDGLELRSLNWSVTPLEIERLESSFFEDGRLFPSGSAELDSALLMRGIQHEWHSRETLCCA